MAIAYRSLGVQQAYAYASEEFRDAAKDESGKALGPSALVHIDDLWSVWDWLAQLEAENEMLGAHVSPAIKQQASANAAIARGTRRRGAIPDGDNERLARALQQRSGRY